LAKVRHPWRALRGEVTVEQKIVGSLVRKAFVFKFLFKTLEGTEVVSCDVSIKERNR
jgi:hypothetical protein